MDELCRICEEPLNENDGRAISKISQKRAVQNIKECAELRGLAWGAFIKEGDSFHSDCRKDFTKRDRIVPVLAPNICKPKTRRESATSISTKSAKSKQFDYRTCCLFCSETICIRDVDERGHCVIKPRKYVEDISFVKSKTWFDTSIRRQIKGRSDDWSFEVSGRVDTVSCLRAEEAVYHRRCLQLFSLQRECPKYDKSNDEATAAKRKRGMKAENDVRNEAFFKLIEYVEESDEEYFTMKHCQDKMKEFTDQPYVTKWLKTRLIQHYGDSIFISNRGGCENVLYFKRTAKSLLYDFYRQSRLEKDEEEKVRVIKLAAELIRTDIQELDFEKDNYFSFDDLSISTMVSFVPEALQFFIRCLTPRRSEPNDIKVAAIGQALIKLARPNTILCPLLLAFAAEMHHKSGGSEFVVDLLHAMGFGSSIDQVRELEKSLCFHDSSSRTLSSTELIGIPLYSADNADILQATLDGKNTLHMMGIIRSVIKHGVLMQTPISRKKPTNEELLKFAIPIEYTGKIDKAEVSIVLKPIKSLNLIDMTNLALNWDLIRVTSSLYRHVSEWSGFMRQITKERKVDNKHDVEFLPFVDMDPNNLSTIYTTLMFVINECKTHEIEPVITFDQPLWFKSMMIKTKNNLSITILLGNFHTQMSYLGSIGYVMKNSGILELFSTVYAENSAKKMLQGKQYERAMRAHDLLATVLRKSVLQEISVENESLFQNVVMKYDEYLRNGVDEETFSKSSINDDCLALQCEFSKICEILSISKLNQLWILYIEMVDLLHMNLMAERSGNWDMYLFSLKCMLPFFAGTGHNNYSRSVYWFLQEMTELNPKVQEEFKKGLFVVRRTNTYWSGVSPDLCIEQTLMASLKGSTGLTRGKSLSDISRLVWTLSRPGILTIDMKMKEITNVRYQSSEQHIDIKKARPSRVDRNKTDMELMGKFCASRFLLQVESLSKLDGNLKNIASGLIAPETVNITDVKKCGDSIIEKMEGTSPLTFSFKKIMQAVQIPSSSNLLKQGKKKVLIDPELLFQRLITVCTDDQQNEALRNELSQQPMSIFDDEGFMRDPKKSDMGNQIVGEYRFHDVVPNIRSERWKKVLDGGMLLHRLPWQVGSPFASILDSYVKHVNNIGENIDIIFDGYLSSNTKDHCHRKRNPIQSNIIEFSSTMLLDCRKDLFLSNSTNKQTFINLLAIWLSSAGHNVIQHTDDADRVIVDRAVALAEENDVCVYADDTDVLILLISKLKLTTHRSVYLRQEKQNRTINIISLINAMPVSKKENILLSHAMTGCDTTSGFFRVGKTKLMKSKILENNPSYKSIFSEDGSDIDAVIDAGENIILQLYGKHRCNSLDELRSVLYKKKLHTKSIRKRIDPRCLPPSSNAAKYHSLRVYHVIQEWLGRSLDPHHYGFFDLEGRLEPITYTEPLAPEYLLKKILCNCQKSECKSGNCSCKNFRLYCNELCGCPESCVNVDPGNEEDNCDSEQYDNTNDLDINVPNT